MRSALFEERATADSRSIATRVVISSQSSMRPSRDELIRSLGSPLPASGVQLLWTHPWRIHSLLEANLNFDLVGRVRMVSKGSKGSLEYMLVRRGKGVSHRSGRSEADKWLLLLF